METKSFDERNKKAPIPSALNLFHKFIISAGVPHNCKCWPIYGLGNCSKLYS